MNWVMTPFLRFVNGSWLHSYAVCQFQFIVANCSKLLWIAILMNPTRSCDLCLRFLTLWFLTFRFSTLWSSTLPVSQLYIHNSAIPNFVILIFVISNFLGGVAFGASGLSLEFFGLPVPGYPIPAPVPIEGNFTANFHILEGYASVAYRGTNRDFWPPDFKTWFFDLWCRTLWFLISQSQSYEHHESIFVILNL